MRIWSSVFSKSILTIILLKYYLLNSQCKLKWEKVKIQLIWVRSVKGDFLQFGHQCSFPYLCFILHDYYMKNLFHSDRNAWLSRRRLGKSSWSDSKGTVLYKWVPPLNDKIHSGLFSLHETLPFLSSISSLISSPHSLFKYHPNVSLDSVINVYE